MSWRNEYLRFREGFREALDARLYTIEHLDALVDCGRALLWFGEGSAIAAEVKHYPTGARVIHGLCAAGNLDEIANELIPQAEAWGRANGCIGSIIESRPGWAKILKSHGYEAHQTALWKDL